MFLKELWMPEIQPTAFCRRMIRLWLSRRLIWRIQSGGGEANHTAGLFTRRSDEMQILKQADVVMLNYMLPESSQRHRVLPICNFMNRALFTLVIK